MTNIRRKSKADRQVPTLRWKAYPLILACGALLVAGFFFAGHQHFSSMDFGMKNSRLRKQIDDLEAEKRRLILAREVSLSPGEIKKAAKKTGIASPENVDGVMAQVASTTEDKAKPPVAQTSTQAPFVVKTAAIAPTARVLTEQRAERPATPEKKRVSAE